MAPQGYNPQGWGMPNYGQQQQWGQPQNQGGGDGASNAGAGAPPGGAVPNVNPATGQADYSLQWAEYYRWVYVKKNGYFTRDVIFNVLHE